MFRALSPAEPDCLSTVHAQATNGGAAIGSSGLDQNFLGPTEFSGHVNIHNSNVTAKTLDEGTPIGAPDDDNGSSYGLFTGSVNVTGNSTLDLIDGRNTELGEQVLIGGSNPASTGAVTVEDSVTIRYFTGTRTGLELNGETSVAAPEQYDQIIQGAEIEVVAVAEVPVYRFWDDVEAKIKAADKGDTITIDVKDRTSIPTRILELVAEYEVTLIIQWNGGDDIIVTPDHGVEVDAETILFTELVTLLK